MDCICGTHLTETPRSRQLDRGKPTSCPKPKGVSVVLITKHMGKERPSDEPGRLDAFRVSWFITLPLMDPCAREFRRVKRSRHEVPMLIAAATDVLEHYSNAEET